jgi:hypothetical protein
VHDAPVRPRDRHAWTLVADVAVAVALALSSGLLLSATPASAGLATVDLQIVKLDDQGTPLPDVVFTLGTSAGVATDGNGAAVFEALFVSSADLSLTETGNPAHHCNDPDDDVLGSLTVDISAGGDITVEDADPTDDVSGVVVSGKGGSAIVITNACGEDSDGSGVTNDVTLDLRILKQDQDGDPLANVAFGVAITDVGATSGTTGADGLLELQDITVDADGEVDLTLTEATNPNDGCDDAPLGSITVDVVTALELIVADVDTSDGLTAEVVGRTIVLTNDCDGTDSGAGGGGTLPDTAAAGAVGLSPLPPMVLAALGLGAAAVIARTRQKV